MKVHVLVLSAMLLLAYEAEAQTKVRVSGGEVTRSSGRVDVTRLAARIPGLSSEIRARIRISADSAQRIALNDFDWSGRVSSVEFDEEDSRDFWDVKIVPDTSQRTIVRYRIDASSGGILGIKEFSGIRGLARRKP